jgi:hypothetical protein
MATEAYQEGPNQAKTRSACEPERYVAAVVVLIPAASRWAVCQTTLRAW